MAGDLGRSKITVLSTRLSVQDVCTLVSVARFSCRLDRESDIPVLYEYASKLQPGDTYLEIGTWMGCSAAVAALASPPETIIWTVDSGAFHESHWQHTPAEYRAILRENFKSCGIAEKIQISLDGSSGTVCVRDIDLLFIDGDHSYKGVSADITKWIPLVSPDGIVLFHDYALYDGVKRAVDELIEGGWQQLSGGKNICAVTRGEATP